MTQEIPEFLRKLREEQGYEETPQPQKFDDDLIPEITPADSPERSQESLEIDSILAKVDIVDAYIRWCGKMVPNVGSKRENIKIRCPNPNHLDDTTSAAINLDLGDGGVYACYACEILGGDKYHIASYHFGLDLDNDFVELRRKMAEDLGYVRKVTPGGQVYFQQTIEAEVTSEPESEEAPNNVVRLFEEQQFELDVAGIRIDWDEIIPPDTFLWEWMQACTIDDAPHEYYFWTGLQALGFAAGTTQLLDDFVPVKPNLYVLVYGSTGSNKSRSLIPYIRLIEEALPYNDDPFSASTGTKILSSPASAEALLKMFSKEVLDPGTFQVTELAQVRGLLRAEEFASFIARASRPTNPMKETLIELYDILDRDMRHTSVGGGTVIARNPFSQMVSTTQPAAIHEFLRRSDAHSGFLNRWVIATGRRRRQRISYGGANIDVSVPATYLKLAKAHCAKERRMQLRGDALDAWDSFFHEKIVPLQDFSDESMFSRIDLTIKKVILLFTLNQLEEEPTQQIVESATSLFNYLQGTYSLFSRDISHNEYEECRQEIIGILKGYHERHNNEPLTLRNINQRLNNKYSQSVVLSVIKTMTEMDELEEHLSSNKRGPKTKMYRYAH